MVSMKMAYELQVRIHRQEDGLWRAEVPGLPGCWVDAPTISQALSDIQGAAALFIDYYAELEEPLPASIKTTAPENFEARLLLCREDHVVKRPAKRARAGRRTA
jgi:predicted RNase H-like HicB family nuclease